MPAVLMVKGSGVERLLPCLRRCNTIIHRKQGSRKKRNEKNNQQLRNSSPHLHILICNIPLLVKPVFCVVDTGSCFFNLFAVKHILKGDDDENLSKRRERCLALIKKYSVE